MVGERMGARLPAIYFGVSAKNLGAVGPNAIMAFAPFPVRTNHGGCLGLGAWWCRGGRGNPCGRRFVTVICCTRIGARSDPTVLARQSPGTQETRPWLRDGPTCRRKLNLATQKAAGIFVPIGHYIIYISRDGQITSSAR